MYKGNTYIYTRCSTEEQRTQGSSHEYQKDSLIRLIKTEQGTNLLGTYSDTITGTTLDRPELNKLYQICLDNPGHVQYILVHKWDRFGRNVEECLKWVRLFRETSVEVNCPHEYIDFRTADFNIMLSLRFSMAETESRKISERTRDGLNHNRRDGYYMATAPMGYKRIKSDSHNSKGKNKLILVPDESAPVIQEIFLAFIRGDSRGELFKTYGKKLNTSKNAFYNMFLNPLYAGKVFCKAYKSYPEAIVDGKHEGILSEKEWGRVRKRLSEDQGSNKGKSWSQVQSETKGVFYLKGVLKCCNSEKLMTASMSTGRSKKYGYYQTPSGKRRTSIKMETAHNLIQNALSELSIEFEVSDVDTIRQEMEEIRKPKQSIVRTLHKKLNKVKNRLSRVEEDYLDRNIDAGTYKSLITKITEQKVSLVDDIRTEESYLYAIPEIELEHLNKIADLPQIFTRSNNETKSKLLKCIFPDKIYIDKESRRVRTTRLNSLLNVKSCKSTDCIEFINKKRTDSKTSPLLGGRRDSNPRLSVPQTDALTN